jgi:hypothetical protein
MQNKLNAMQWKVPKHPACSQELLPCDFHIFGSLQIAVKGHTLTLDGHVREAVEQWFRQQHK